MSYSILESELISIKPSDPGQETLRDRRCISYHCEAKVVGCSGWRTPKPTAWCKVSPPSYTRLPRRSRQGFLISWQLLRLQCLFL